MFSHSRHLTLTESPEILMNFFEPHFGQIGQARRGFISVQWVWCQID